MNRSIDIKSKTKITKINCCNNIAISRIDNWWHPVINILTRLLTDTSLSWQSLMSIEQYTIGAAATWATPNLPLGPHPIIPYWLLCSAAIVILYISHLHYWIVTCIINMYLDPSVSINCKYKIMNKNSTWSFNNCEVVREKGLMCCSSKYFK